MARLRGWGPWMWIGALLLWMAVPVQAQVPEPSTPAWHWERYTQDGGLLSNDVRAVLIAENSVWLGTDQGLARYDGQWTRWPVDPEGGIDGTVEALAQERSGGLWLGTSRGTLARWDGQPHTRGALERVAQAPGGILALLESQRQVWVGTVQGLFQWNGSELTPVEAIRAPVRALARQDSLLWVGTDDGLWVLQRDRWARFGVEDGLPGNEVRALWIEADGRVWVGTTAGLGVRDVVTGTWRIVPTEGFTGEPYHVLSLAGSPDGSLWGGTAGNGIFWITPDGTLVPFGGDVGLTHADVRAVAVDGEGSLWFGTATGLYRNDFAMWVSHAWGSELQINATTALLEDREGALWMGTNVGVRVALPPSPEVPAVDPLLPEVMRYGRGDGLPSETVFALAEDPQGAVWIATDSGLARFDRRLGRWEQPIPPEALPSPLVHTLLATDSLLWIGSDQGLARYDLRDGSLETVAELGDVSVRALALDREGRIWVGTLIAGIFVREGPGQWRRFPPTRSDAWEPGSGTVPNGPVMALAAAADGVIWAGINDYGVVRWDGRRWLAANADFGLPNKIVNVLYVDPVDGSLWVGTDGGITRYDGRTATTLEVSGVLQPAPAYAILRSAQGSYWFGTQNGLTYFRADRTPPWIAVGEIQGEPLSVGPDRFQVQTDQELSVQVRAGDLHTPDPDLVVLYRVRGPGMEERWQTTSVGYQPLPAFPEPGSYTVEFVARDLSFNYSDVRRLDFQVVLPPPTVTLPGLGLTLERDVALAMAGLLLVALVSFLYVALEIARSMQRTREAIRRGYNPFVSGEPIRRADLFFGRGELLQRIVDSLHENSIMIHGERRIGKTSLLYHLRDRLRELDDPEYWFMPIYIDLEGTPEPEFFHFLMEEILHGVLSLPEAEAEIRPHLQEMVLHTKRATRYTYRDFMRDFRRLVGVLQDYVGRHHPGKKLRIILLMDEMDVISEYSRHTQQQLRRIFMQNAELGAVVAGIRISREWDRIESPWYNMFVEFELQPFSQEEAEALLTEPIEEYYAWKPRALEFVIQQSQGRPFRLQQYAREAVNHMLQRGRRTITMADVEAAHRHIQSLDYDPNVGIQEAMERHSHAEDVQAAALSPAPPPGTDPGEPHA